MIYKGYPACRICLNGVLYNRNSTRRSDSLITDGVRDYERRDDRQPTKTAPGCGSGPRRYTDTHGSHARRKAIFASKFTHWRKPHPRTHYRSEEHTSELQSHSDLVCRLLLEKKKTKRNVLNQDYPYSERSSHIRAVLHAPEYA